MKTLTGLGNPNFQNSYMPLALPSAVYNSSNLIMTARSILTAALWQSVVGAWPALRFTDEGTFQIAIFGDLHFGEAEDTDWGPLQDIDTLKVMQAVLLNETPQVVVLNGDLITGENTFKENSADYIDEIVAPLEEFGLPWASTYGSQWML